jgi:DNA-binding NtrC family response regulator
MEPKRTHRILLVDDDADFLEYLEMELKAQGFEVALARSGREGFATLNAQAGFDAVISDISMPDGDGVSFLKEVRRARLSIPFFLVSGEMDMSLEEAQRLTADGFFIKPFKIMKLIQAVTVAIQDRARAR